MENNNDKNYDERVNSNKEFINNYGKTSYNKNTSIYKNTNIKSNNNINKNTENNNANTNINTNNNSNNKNNKKDDLIFYGCCFFGICQISLMFQSIELFLISLVILIVSRKKFFYVICGLLAMGYIIGIIAFGVCVFSIFNMY